MRVALIGASGEAGSRILNELLSRGHLVTGVVRSVDKLPRREGLVGVAADADDVGQLAKAIEGHDAVISSIRYVASDPVKLIAAVKASGVPRYLVVGGAGGLMMPGTKVMVKDATPYPDFVMHEANRGLMFLNLLREEKVLNWTFLAPGMYFKDTGRIGVFRLGLDEVLVDAEGQSKISFDDYAIAMVDELENPRHPRRRFTVSY